MQYHYERDAHPGGVQSRSALLAALALGLPLAGCAGPADEAQPDVVASFYPLEFLARSIGEPEVRVGVVVPAGVEPHDYEPTPGDLARILDAKLVLLQGAAFEGWIQTASEKQHAARFVTVTDDATLLDNPDPEEAHEEPKDPHVWLDPSLYARTAQRVADELSVTFPEHRARFEARRDALVANLTALDAELEAGLSDCDVRVVVTNHAAFQYLAARYNLTMIAISGLEPEAEPTPQTLQDVIEQVRAHNITIVYFEELVSPAVAEAVAREAGAQTRVLSPIEGIAPDEPDATYLTKMRDNLAALREGLRCR